MQSSPGLSPRRASPTNTRPVPSLEEMSAEGREILAKKDAELQSYVQALTDAQRILTDLNQQIEAKTAELRSISTDDQSRSVVQAEIARALADLDLHHRVELEKMREKHNSDISSLRSEFERTLQDAREWAARHADVALQQKQWELEQLKTEAQDVKRQLHTAIYVKDRRQESRALDDDHQDRAREIADLEEQISELSALTREEMRDARAKIADCVAAVELRAQSNAAELAKLEDEAADRKERYDAHVNALREECALERSALEREIAAINDMMEGTKRITERLERQHETRLAEAAGDVDILRRSAAAPTSVMMQHRERMKSAVREVERLRIECMNMELEEQASDREIEELRRENKQLKKELEKISKVATKGSV